MKYDDFSLPENWENIAKAYTKQINDKGFVFIRLDQNQNRKISMAKNCLQLLSHTTSAYCQIGKITTSQKQHFKNMFYLTQNFAKQLSELYFLKNAQEENHKINTINLLPKLICLEAQITKNILLLLEEEDDLQKNAILKNNFLSRLEVLENLNN